MLKIDANFKGRMSCVFINDIRNLVNFTGELKNLKIFTLGDFFCQRYIREYTLSMKEGGGRFNKFFKKYFVAQDTTDLNISRPSNFFRKYFMAPPINFSFLIKAYL